MTNYLRLHFCSDPDLTLHHVFCTIAQQKSKMCYILNYEPQEKHVKEFSTFKGRILHFDVPESEKKNPNLRKHKDRTKKLYCQFRLVCEIPDWFALITTSLFNLVT